MVELIPKTPFTMQDALRLGITRGYLRKWLEEEKIERVSRGVYKLYSYDFDKNTLLREASVIVGNPSVVCLLSALEFYDLTDYIPKRVWIMSEISKKTSVGSIRLFRTRNPKWEIGIDKRNGFLITSLERTLVDCLLHRERIGSSIVLSALKLALEGKKTTVAKLVKMAKKLEVWHRLDTILEVVAA